MASASEEVSVLQDELTCPVCLDLYRDPHLLPCGHSFCLQCLHRLRGPSRRALFRCPECRQSHRASAAQKNYKLCNIADSFRQLGQEKAPPAPGAAGTPDAVRCDYCVPAAAGAEGGAEDGAALAVKTCMKCEVSMCHVHVKPHLELPAFRGHPLVEPTGDMRSRKCPEHDEMFHYYCVDEKVCVCNACTIEGGHAGHTIKTLKNAMKDLKVSLGVQLRKVERRIGRTEKMLQEHRENQRQNKAFVDDADQRLAALGDALKAELETFVSGLVECAHGQGSASGQSAEQVLDCIGRDHARLQDVRQAVQGLLQESDPFRFIKVLAKAARMKHTKRLFSPDYPGPDPEALSESMEARLDDLALNPPLSVFSTDRDVEDIETGEEEEEEDDDDDDENYSDDEEEEEMHSEEEECLSPSGSGDELYEEEEEEEEEEDAEEEGEEEDDVVYS
uniref:Uncharacterized protein n=1 Tax=Denticeps clupeoides TaxID=299321 RepID=A0AAY4DH61_9TELE